ncbi:uncharacterized protein LOC133817803 [Humulus lupulus]|uniref:uncharacterized protein LOC133817803 n=1 Tax=Humulus lupulus TaxID=3486 RepID=UPI002B414715|nr:uncharacterized protein LOC133817803 [Humulus lupulus]
MIFPKRVLAKISAICRAFLWKGQVFSMNSGNIAWDQICKPKKAGGLGFKDCYIWNIATIDKYIWAVAEKKDNLWVKWVHDVYIRDKDWWDYVAPVQSSWYWRKIVQVKDQFKNLRSLQQLSTTGYQIRKGYQLLSPIIETVHWCKEVWGRLNIPKHSFILWLAVQNRLKTKERLQRFNILNDSTCLLCNSQPESATHLFFGCSISLICLRQVQLWLGWNANASSLVAVLRWIERAKLSKFRKLLYSAAVAAVTYQIWKGRNEVLWSQKQFHIDVVVQLVKDNIVS